MGTQENPTPGQDGVTAALVRRIEANEKRPPVMRQALVAILREREARGIATYGTSLQTFNGRSALVDALEESVDKSQYLLQELLEREALERQLALCHHVLLEVTRAGVVLDIPAVEELAEVAGAVLRDWVGPRPTGLLSETTG